jgi:hypothetical protein
MRYLRTVSFFIKHYQIITNNFGGKFFIPVFVFPTAGF